MYIDYVTTFKGLFKQGVVVGIDTSAKTVMLEGGESVPYDILVLSTGCDGPFPGKLWKSSKDDAIEQYTEYNEKVRVHVSFRC